MRLSAHADRDDLLAWTTLAGAPACVFLGHGEDIVRKALVSVLKDQGHSVMLPAHRERPISSSRSPLPLVSVGRWVRLLHCVTQRWIPTLQSGRALPPGREARL